MSNIVEVAVGTLHTLLGSCAPRAVPTSAPQRTCHCGLTCECTTSEAHPPKAAKVDAPGLSQNGQIHTSRNRNHTITHRSQSEARVHQNE
eukprot:5145999-Prymnesium_polylepis.1